MKKILIRGSAVMLAVALVLCSFVGCYSKGKAFMEIDDTEISVNLFQLFLSRMKGTLCSAYAFGEEALRDSFWDTVMSTGGETYNDYYTAQVLENTKTYLAALYAFEREGLKLPAATLDEIDEEIERLIEQDANGSKTEFNSMLAQYGVNYKMLREAYIIEAKIAYLNDHLFGDKGSKISKNLLEDYYQANYVRFKHVFIYTYALVYETDADGQDIYYNSKDSKKISYDKTAIVKVDKDGKTVKDKNGDTVYVNADGKIAYDKKDAVRNPVLDEKGYQKTRPYTKDELISASDRAQLIMEECEEGNYPLFDRIVSAYSEDEGMEKYTNGYYLTAESEYDSTEVRDALFEMKDGEIKRINSDYGIHIVMKYKLDEGGYANSENSDFFISTETGNYVFMNELKSYLLGEYLKGYVGMIEIDKSLIANVNIKNVGANFNY